MEIEDASVAPILPTKSNSSHELMKIVRSKEEFENTNLVKISNLENEIDSLKNANNMLITKMNQIFIMLESLTGPIFGKMKMSCFE